MPEWQGQSKGTPLGYRIFVWICTNLGLAPAYFVLRFVAGYYFLFSFKSTGIIYQYFRKRHAFSVLSSLGKTYRNNYLLGQTLIDKMVAYAGFKTSFTFDFDGEENLRAMAKLGRGGILLS